MNKDLLLAKIRRWKAELGEIIETLNGEGKSGPIMGMLGKRQQEMEDFIASIEENNFMPKEAVDFEPEPVMNEIEAKVKRVKQGVKKIQKLSEEKSKIIDDLTKDD